MGYKLFDGNLNTLSDSTKTVINTINQYSYCVAEHDEEFKTALMESDVLLPDGVGIVIGVKNATGYNLKKISGTDLHQSMLTRLSRNGGRGFYLGSNNNTLSKIKQRLETEHPNITCGFFSPPFKAAFTDEENAAMVNAINEFKPDVVFVGMTAPKQEKWINQHKHNVDAKFICSIGAVFDFYAGTVQRPSEFWVNLGLEWFVRLCREPKRMWKRYIYYGPIFLYALLKDRLLSGLHERPEIAYSEQPE